jgi:hypothetical protein
MHDPALVLEREDVRVRRPDTENQGDDGENQRQRESVYYDSLLPEILQRCRVYPTSV